MFGLDLHSPVVRIRFSFTRRLFADNMYTVAQPNRTTEHCLHWNSLAERNISEAFNCIANVFLFLDNNYGNEEIEILITGSLHLVGEAMRTIQS